VRPWGRFESRQPADERFSRDVRWGNLPERWRGTASVQGKPARERRFGDRRAAPRADVRVPTLVLHRRSDRVIPHGRRDGSQPRCRARSSSHSKARRTCRGRAMGTPSLRRSRRSAAFAMRVRIGPSSRSTGRTTTPLSRRCSTGAQSPIRGRSSRRTSARTGEYLASLAPYRTARGFECPAEFVFATAAKP
jgi:hypothetical protein